MPPTCDLASSMVKFLKTTGRCARPPPPALRAIPGRRVGRRGGEARYAQDELHSAAQAKAKAWADGDFDVDHDLGPDGVIRSIH
jgi:hypothetical protein